MFTHLFSHNPARTALLPVLLTILALLSLPSVATAQTETTTGVRGVVKSQAEGSVIQGASVTVSNDALQIKRDATTDEEGRFAVFGLPPGVSYEVSVVAEGFRPYVHRSVNLVSGEAATMDLALEVNVLQETVNVTGDTSAVVNNAPEISQVVDTRQTMMAIA